MVGVPMLKAERISRSGPKLSDAQTRNFEAIKYTAAPSLISSSPAATSSAFRVHASRDSYARMALSMRVTAFRFVTGTLPRTFR